MQKSMRRVALQGILLVFWIFVLANTTHATTATPTPPPAPGATTTVDKELCRSLIGYESLETLKRDLELEAKREAANELFGEIIVATTTVQNWIVTEDQLRSQSLGMIRVKGSPEFSSGENLGEICVALTVYVTDKDYARFEPLTREGRACVSGADRPIRQARAEAEEEARLQVLYTYDMRLQGYETQAVLPLLRQITYPESRVPDGTDNYCVTASGSLVPIEVEGFLALNGALPLLPDAPPTATVTPAPTATAPMMSPTETSTPTPTDTPSPSPTPDGDATGTAVAATVEAARQDALAAQATTTQQAAVLRVTLTAGAPTPTPAPSGTPSPAVTSRPTQRPSPASTPRPSATSTRLPTLQPPAMTLTAAASTSMPSLIPTARPGSALVSLLYPENNEKTTDRLDFAWTPIDLPPGFAYELVFWCCDPAAAMVDGRGYAGGYTTDTSASMNFAVAGLPFGEYRWAILLVQQTPYRRLEQISEVRTVWYFERGPNPSGGSGSVDTGTGSK